MIQFARPWARPAFRSPAAPTGGIRWFREPGAWVERPRALPAVSPPRLAGAGIDPLTRRFHGR